MGSIQSELVGMKLAIMVFLLLHVLTTGYEHVIIAGCMIH